ncbi:hypothetical protein C8R44DRAFT_809178 [Mycena epipterygia]|nr:hypothetical protein C8R44DRAFT_809178 [Mycena epipterygia]
MNVHELPARGPGSSNSQKKSQVADMCKWWFSTVRMLTAHAKFHNHSTTMESNTAVASAWPRR